MDERTTDFDGRVTAGRKGVPYDWQAVLADAGRADGRLVGAAAGVSGSRSEPALVAL